MKLFYYQHFFALFVIGFCLSLQATPGTAGSHQYPPRSKNDDIVLQYRAALYQREDLSIEERRQAIDMLDRFDDVYKESFMNFYNSICELSPAKKARCLNQLLVQICNGSHEGYIDYMEALLSGGGLLPDDLVRFAVTTTHVRGGPGGFTYQCLDVKAIEVPMKTHGPLKINEANDANWVQLLYAKISGWVGLGR